MKRMLILFAIMSIGLMGFSQASDSISKKERFIRVGIKSQWRFDRYNYDISWPVIDYVKKGEKNDIFVGLLGKGGLSGLRIRLNYELIQKTMLNKKSCIKPIYGFSVITDIIKENQIIDINFNGLIGINLDIFENSILTTHFSYSILRNVTGSYLRGKMSESGFFKNTPGVFIGIVTKLR
jgi:hypothetical protein